MYNSHSSAQKSFPNVTGERRLMARTTAGDEGDLVLRVRRDVDDCGSETFEKWEWGEIVIRQIRGTTSSLLRRERASIARGTATSEAHPCTPRRAGHWDSGR